MHGEFDIEDLAKAPLGLDSSNSRPTHRSSVTVPTPPQAASQPSENTAIPAASGESSLGEVFLPGNQSVWVKTFGCSHNTSDAEYMAGQLQEYGYTLVPDDLSHTADAWVVNSCTVKGPSQSAVGNLIAKARESNKAVVVSGCVPQGDRKAKELEGVSVVGVTQIDRIVEAVEETLKGNTVSLLQKKALPRLDLPKIRKNPYVEIIPLSTGCLGACTYCKTKHARGVLGSYDPAVLLKRVKSAVLDPLVREIWLSSEDTGAYGRDINSSLPALLNLLLAELPTDGSTMLRIGMTNPPFILEHLDAIAECLQHPACFNYLHVPVQSGSDRVLTGMNREYTIADFRTVCDTLLLKSPGIELATDIIAGFPGETDEDHKETMALIQKYHFPHCHISQFYPRPGTPAARMKRVDTKIVKERSREITKEVDCWGEVYKTLVGTTQQCTVVDTAADGIHFVAHNKTYCQVLIAKDAPDGSGSVLGCVVEVNVLEAGRWYVKGEVCKVLYRPPDRTTVPFALGAGDIKGEVGVQRKEVKRVSEMSTIVGTQVVDSSKIKEKSAPGVSASVESESTAKMIEEAAEAYKAVTSSTIVQAGKPAMAIRQAVPRQSPDSFVEGIVWFGVVIGLFSILISGLITLFQQSK